MRITEDYWGTLLDGKEVMIIRLENDKGTVVRVLNFGGIIQSIITPDRFGNPADIVLGYDALAEYESDDCYFGATIGRVANRIAGASFELNGQLYELTANEGIHINHGGGGFHKKLWEYEVLDDALVLKYTSPDGEDGFPGALQVEQRITLSDDNALRLEYHAVSDQTTLCSLTGHSYFNLAGVGGRGLSAEKTMVPSVSGHQLQIGAYEFTPVDETQIPTGEIKSVEGTIYNFLNARNLGTEALDGNLILSHANSKWDARVFEPISGRFLSVRTSLPGMQIYNGTFITKRNGKEGAVYGPQCGFALEPQFFPDAVHHPEFPQPILKAGEEYCEFIEYRFGVV